MSPVLRDLRKLLIKVKLLCRTNTTCSICRCHRQSATGL